MLGFIVWTILVMGVVSATPVDIDGKVVGGENADIQDYPYMVAVRSYNSFTCGGTLLGPEWVLTAGHCVSRTSDPSRYSITYSSTNLTSPYSPVYASQIIVHSGYDPIELIHDIALLRLVQPVLISRYVRLPRQFDDISDGTPGILIGWGLDMTGGTVQEILQRATLRVYSDMLCSARHTYAIFPSNICAGVEAGGQGQCSGDSGGPLHVFGTQVGIVSWSVKPCTVAPYPGVYTQVSYYREWIRQMTRI